MIGAIIGDIVGSRFEFNNHRSKEFKLFTPECFPTDDSIMTIAIMAACMDFETYYELSGKAVRYMRSIGRKYPNCGYGGRFAGWMFSEHPMPYNSYGNGAAMRVSPVAYFAKDLDDLVKMSRAVTAVTHNHFEGIKGAECVSFCIWGGLHKWTKEEIRKCADMYYDLNFTLDEIRGTYKFNESCQETVPQAIVAFLESADFEDAIRNAISIGGDSDTLAAITGSIAEAFYGVPGDLYAQAVSYLDFPLYAILRAAEESYEANK